MIFPQIHVLAPFLLVSVAMSLPPASLSTLLGQGSAPSPRTLRPVSAFLFTQALPCNADVTYLVAYFLPLPTQMSVSLEVALCPQHLEQHFPRTACA